MPLQQKVNHDHNTNKKQVNYKHANSNTLKPSTTAIIINDIFSVLLFGYFYRIVEGTEKNIRSSVDVQV